MEGKVSSYFLVMTQNCFVFCFLFLHPETIVEGCLYLKEKSSGNELEL